MTMRKEDVLNFANNMFGIQFLRNENIIVWVMFDLSNGTDIHIPKNDLIDAVNLWQKTNGLKITEDGAIWDKYFNNLKKKGYIETEIFVLNLTAATLNMAEKIDNDRIIIPVSEFITQYGVGNYLWMKANGWAGKSYVRKKGIKNLPTDY